MEWLLAVSLEFDFCFPRVLSRGSSTGDRQFQQQLDLPRLHDTTDAICQTTKTNIQLKVASETRSRPSPHWRVADDEAEQPRESWRMVWKSLNPEQLWMLKNLLTHRWSQQEQRRVAQVEHWRTDTNRQWNWSSTAYPTGQNNFLLQLLIRPP